MVSRLVITLSILCLISGVVVAYPEETPGTSSENIKYYTFRLGKIRMEDRYNYPSISKEIRDVLVIRFLIPPQDVNQEYPFYPLFNKDWWKNNFDIHIGLTLQGKPNLYLTGGSIRLNKFIDIVCGLSFSDDPEYKHNMYYWGITLESELFQHIIDMIQEGILKAQK